MDSPDPSTATAPRQPYTLLAAGFNAFGQLSDHRLDDIRAAYPTLTLHNHVEIRVLFAGWSSTVLVVGGKRLVGLGHQAFDYELDAELARGLKGGFGDHDGMIGCLDDDGRLYLLREREGIRDGVLECLSEGESATRISHVALAGNGRLAIVLREPSEASQDYEFVEFEQCSYFVRWMDNSSNTQMQKEAQRFRLPSRPLDLIANTATFLLRTDSGEVYSWGDARHQSLGRSINDEGSIAADKPGLVDALGGLRIRKIACGGWICAALSEDGALYIWGVGSPGGDLTIKPLREVGAGEVALVELAEVDGEVVDVVDVAVGDNHLVAIDERHRLWVVGSNSNGQLALDSQKVFIDDWTLVQSPEETTFHSVTCGPKCTLVLAQPPLWSP